MDKIYQAIEQLQYPIMDMITSPYFWLIALLSLLFLMIIRHYYVKYVKTPMESNYKANKEYGVDDSRDADLYIFYTTWCPYCKTARETLDQYKVEHKTINNVKINYLEVNAEEHEDLADKYKVESYPTIVLDYDGKKVLYDANVKPELLDKFFEVTLK